MDIERKHFKKKTDNFFLDVQNANRKPNERTQQYSIYSVSTHQIETENDK